MQDVMKLAKLSWEHLNENTEIVILGMGLALHDVEAAHSKGDPGDKPPWVHRSHLKMQRIKKVMECWAEQLGEHTDNEDNGGHEQEGKTKTIWRQCQQQGLVLLQLQSRCFCKL
jgi:hypothetical protein